MPFPPGTLIRRPVGTIPQGVPRVDWNHPINAGLLACYMPAASLTDLCGRGPRLVALSGTGFQVTQYGSGTTAGYQLGYYAPLPTSLQPSMAFSMHVAGSSLSITSGNYADGCGLTYTTSPGQAWSAPYVAFLVRVVEGSGGASQYSPQLLWNSGDVLGSGLYLSPKINNTGQAFSILGTLQVGGSVIGYVNGGPPSSTTTGGSAVAYGSTPYFFVGAGATGEYGVSAVVARLWGNVRSQGDAIVLAADPFAGLIFPSDEVETQLKPNGAAPSVVPGIPRFLPGIPGAGTIGGAAWGLDKLRQNRRIERREFLRPWKW
jgi:hypothetical protein